MVLVAFVAALLNVPATASPPLNDLDAYVHQSMQQWRVPGTAVAVVKDGKVVLARGYGVRELGKLDKVDADTLFDIGQDLAGKPDKVSLLQRDLKFECVKTSKEMAK